MCTVTYLPIGKLEYILTSNRDESIARKIALPVSEYQIHSRSVYFPKDQHANGTWIAHETSGYTLCLLNGANSPHTVKGEYRKSRGLMLLDFFEFNDPREFAKKYSFFGIEPFTLIIVASQPIEEKLELFELKWDETKTELIIHDPALPHIWSSVTLYKPEVILQRKAWFNEWLNKHNNAFLSETILFFHHFGGVGDMKNDLVINRDDKKTVSICCVNRSCQFTEIIYEDIVNQKLYKNKVIHS